MIPHPYYAVTDAQGGFQIKEVPAGKYALSVRHELGKPLTKTIEITAGQILQADLSLEPKAP